MLREPSNGRGFNSGTKELFLKLFNLKLNFDFIDQEIFAAGRRLYELLENPVYLKISDNTILKMANIRRIGKVHESLQDTDEFLLATIPGAGTGTLESLMKRHGMRGIYGSQTLKVLEEIGWPTRRRQNPVKLHIVDVGADFLDNKNSFVIDVV